MVETQRNMNGNDLVGRVWVDAPEHLGGQRAYIRIEDANTVRTVWTDTQAVEGQANATTLIEALQGHVQSATLHALRAQLVPTTISPLVHRARTGEARVILTFAGQAQSYFDDLERLYEIPNARRLIRICADALKNEVDGRAAFEGYHPHGLDLVRWIEDPRPDLPPSSSRKV